MRKVGLLCTALLAAPVTLISAETHEKVQEALNWELPVNECKKPRLVGAGLDIVDGIGTRSTDISSHKMRRYNRKVKRWQRCVSKYREALMKDFEELKNCAQYGLTQQQAETILGKLALIQAVVISPEGVVEEEVSKDT